MTTFFVPGIEDDARASESAYREMYRQTELEMGHRPSSRRIMGLWTRTGSVDRVTHVGGHDPLRGGTVIAIFDMGPHQPFVVWWQDGGGSGDGIRERVERTSSVVLEFDA